MLVRPGTIYGMIENKLSISINAQFVIIHDMVLAQTSCIETDPVVLSGEIKFGIRIHPVSHQGVACGEKHSFPILFPSHGEGVVSGFSIKEGLVRRADSAYGIWLDGGHKRTDVRKLGYAVFAVIDNACLWKRAGSLRISGYIYNAVSYSSKKITVAVLADEGELFRSVYVDYDLLSQIGLFHHTFVYGLFVCFDDKPCARIGTLVVSWAHDKGNLVVALVEPEISISLLHSGKGL